MATELSIFMNDKRMITTQAKAPAQARQVGQQISLSSPGFIYEPYEPREKIPFWKRWFTMSGWRRTKLDIILELKSAYAIAKLRKKGYSKKQFYKEAVNMYKECWTISGFSIAIEMMWISSKSTRLSDDIDLKGDHFGVIQPIQIVFRRTNFEEIKYKRHFALKNEIKQRESAWSKVYWEMVEPVVMIRTLRARLGNSKYSTNMKQEKEHLPLLALDHIKELMRQLANTEASLIKIWSHWIKLYVMLNCIVTLPHTRVHIGVDRKDLDKTFIQLTLEILAKQKFEAYDSKGSVVAGDKSKEVLVRDIWVFEKSMFHPGARWRLCGRITPKAS
ncbi:hypothetical protein V8G54_028259 [Vigna mungo]|uniref:Large ribosomal subunit protein mL45 n=1 Tax=Vigna mungo TaxID=3915 RepID=A0AAQ3RI02_VIGMU